jgi:hypothetical protein
MAPFKSQHSLADMSQPTDKRTQRQRRKGATRKKGKGTTKQMTHANGSEQNKRRRTWEKKNKRSRKGLGLCRNSTSPISAARRTPSGDYPMTLKHLARCEIARKILDPNRP